MARVAVLFLVCLITSGLLPVQAADNDPIAIVVHKSNPADNVTRAELKWIYSGRKNRWADGQKILVLDRPMESEHRGVFYRVVLGVEPGHEFRAAGSPTAFKPTKRKSDRSVKRFVSRISNAVGYLYKSNVDDSVKVLAIDGLTPDDEQYPLK